MSKENKAQEVVQNLGTAESVKTPLVDALQKYFQKTLLLIDVVVDGKKEGQILAEADTSSWRGVYGTNG